MTDEKLTDEEIMETLENCAFSAHNSDACKECHYNNVRKGIDKPFLQGYRLV